MPLRAKAYAKKKMENAFLLVDRKDFHRLAFIATAKTSLIIYQRG